MNGEKAQNGKQDGVRSVYLALYFLGAVLSGVGGNILYLRNYGAETLAPDRFTGKQGAALIERVSHLERDMTTHFTTHPDMVNQFDRRITVLEVQYDGIIQYLERIDKKLDKLSP